MKMNLMMIFKHILLTPFLLIYFLFLAFISLYISIGFITLWVFCVILNTESKNEIKDVIYVLWLLPLEETFELYYGIMDDRKRFNKFRK